MDPKINQMLAKARVDDLLAEAAAHRLASQLKAERPSSNGTRIPSWSAVGRAASAVLRLRPAVRLSVPWARATDCQ